MKKLVRTDKNGTRYYEEECKCWKCGGTGTYYWGAVINGNPQYAGMCYACQGSGVTVQTTKEYTPEHQAKLDKERAKREAKREEERQAREAERQAKQEEQERRQAEWEAKIKAEKEASNYVGQVGDKVDMVVTYKFKAEYETQYGTMHIFSMKDEAGNTLVWKTTGWLDPDNDNTNKGDKIRIKATIKEHNEYRDEKQTILTRVKVLEIVERAEG